MQFTPEVMNETMGSCFLWGLFELFALKGAMLSIQAPIAILDLVAFMGYKYVGLCINMVFGLLFGYWPYWLISLYTGASIFYFMINTLKKVIPTNGIGQRKVIILIAGALQLFMMYFLGYMLGYTTALSKSHELTRTAIAEAAKAAKAASN